MNNLRILAPPPGTGRSDTTDTARMRHQNANVNADDLAHDKSARLRSYGPWSLCLVILYPGDTYLASALLIQPCVA